VFAIPMTWFEGELVFCPVYTLSYFSSHCFSSIYCFTCYTNVYLDDYAYHCTRVSRNEM
jgi:hypothetical protein